MEAEVVHIEQAKAAIHPSIRKQATDERKRRTPAEKIMHQVERDGLLPFYVRAGYAEAIALQAFLTDLHAGWGRSGALQPIDYDRTFGAGGQGFLPKDIATDAYARAEAVWRRMHLWERGVLIWLGKSRGRPNVTLAMFGRECGNGSSHDNSAAQQGVGLILAIARTAMEVYDVSQLYNPATAKRLAEVPR